MAREARAAGMGGESRDATTIDGTFAPRPAPDVAGIEIDGETVLLEGRRLAVQHLDRVATIAWRFFDGTATLDELAEDLADAFGAGPDVVRSDLLALARELGRNGLLDGIEPDPPPDPPGGQTGLPIGAPLAPFRGVALDGTEIGLDAYLGRPLVIVNWSPTCGYCDQAAEGLAELERTLAAAGESLVLLATGTAEENRAMLDRHGVTLPVVLRAGDLGDDEPFAGLGTPVGYRLDATAAVATPLAVGAAAVLALGTPA